MDFGCGKGGDLQKWVFANAGFYIGNDIVFDMILAQHI
jgi:hypothetical protein